MLSIVSTLSCCFYHMELTENDCTLVMQQLPPSQHIDLEIWFSWVYGNTGNLKAKFIKMHPVLRTSRAPKVTNTKYVSSTWAIWCYREGLMQARDGLCLVRELLYFCIQELGHLLQHCWMYRSLEGIGATIQLRTLIKMQCCPPPPPGPNVLHTTLFGFVMFYHYRDSYYSLMQLWSLHGYYWGWCILLP